MLLDCVMVIGSEKGYVFPYDIMIDPKTKKKAFDPQNEGGKVIVSIAYEIFEIERKCKDRPG